MAARRLTPGGRPSMQARKSIVERLAAEAIRHGATFLWISSTKTGMRRSSPHGVTPTTAS
jgi:hypothetical protein